MRFLKYLGSSLVFSLIIFSSVTFAQFSDIQKDSLTYLHRHDLIEGYPDGTFKPQQQVSRAELVKMVLDANNIPLSGATNCFLDVPNAAWYENYLCTAKNNGYIQEYPDGTFHPEQLATKVEALKVIAQVQNWELLTDPLPGGFHDVPPNAWYYDYVKAAVNYAYIDQVDHFYPNASITREEIAEILFRTILEKKMGVTKSIGTDLALLSRDFFRIEAVALTKTYADLETFKNQQKPFQKGFDYQAGKPIMEEPQTLITGPDGNIYALMRLQVPGPQPDGWLESEAGANHSRANILFIAKFDPSKKLLAFDWYNYFSGPTTGHFFKLSAADNNKVTVQIWSSEASGINSLWSTKEFALKDLKNS